MFVGAGEPTRGIPIRAWGVASSAGSHILVIHDLDFSRILVAWGDTAPSVIVLRIRKPTPAALCWSSSLPAARSPNLVN